MKMLDRFGEKMPDPSRVSNPDPITVAGEHVTMADLIWNKILLMGNGGGPKVTTYIVVFVCCFWYT